MQSQSPAPRRSAAGIRISKPSATSSPEDDHLDCLRKLKASCGANKHDQALTLISACISGGIDTRARIISMLNRLGMNPAHVALMIDEHTGTNSERHYWFAECEGRYALLE